MEESMKKLASVVVLSGGLAGCYTGPTYTKPGPDNDKQAMESQLKKCESKAAAPGSCQMGSDGYNYCLKAKTMSCMRDAGWTQQ
jgi:hypothetical protein